MNFQDMQNEVVANALSYGEKYGITIDESFALIKLYEEMGEFSQALLIHKKQSRPEKHVSEELSKAELAKELADVVGMAMVNAYVLGINLEEALSKKWIKRHDEKTT